MLLAGKAKVEMVETGRTVAEFGRRKVCRTQHNSKLRIWYVVAIVTIRVEVVCWIVVCSQKLQQEVLL